jgi:hypothetical protein
MEHKCAPEIQILQTALSLSSIALDEMTFRIMRTPGYTAITARKVIHYDQMYSSGMPSQMNECHNELPVRHQNQIYFLTKVQNSNQIRHSKGLRRATHNHVQNPRLLVPIDAKIGRNNTST